VAEHYALRRAALRESIRSAGIDALLIVDLLNVRYLTGFTGSNAALIVRADGTPGNETGTVLCTDGRYVTQSAQQVPDLERHIDRRSDVAVLAKAVANASGGRRVGYESQHVTVEQLDGLTEVAGDTELVRAPGLVERLRLVKDEIEIDALRMACAAADQALAQLLTHGGLRPGRTERDVARELENRMLDNGATGISFETIVATGAHSAIPHHRPTDAELRTGDFVKLDFGALVDGYHSDMTRTFVLGAADDWQRDLYALVAAAQAAGRAALTPGRDVAKVDAAAREIIAAGGYDDEFSHGLGHGVGLHIHEAPTLAKTGAGRLAAGMAVTVEPGVYLAGRGGVRIEDTLVVRDGAPELLTLTTKDLVVI
jgi:Xaa-Pro dipeptidase